MPCRGGQLGGIADSPFFPPAPPLAANAKINAKCKLPHIKSVKLTHNMFPVNA